VDDLNFNLLVIACACALLWRRLTNRVWAAADTPTIKTGHVVMGKVEVSGMARPATPSAIYTSPFTGKPCVWWSASVKHFTSSSDGNEWVTMHCSMSSPWLAVDDGTGPVLVHIPDNRPYGNASNTYKQNEVPAQLAAQHLDTTVINAVVPAATAVAHEKKAARWLSRPDLLRQKKMVPVSGKLNPAQPFQTMQGKWQIREEYIELNAPLYVIGNVVYDDVMDCPRFQQLDDRTVHVYNGTEQRLLRNVRWLAILAGLLCALSVFLGVALRLADDDGVANHVAVKQGALAVAVLGVIWTLLQVMRIRNRIAATAEQVKSGHGLFAIALKKRADLVPALTAVVQGAVGHSESILARLASLRATDASGAPVMHELQIVEQRYPSLSTAPNFSRLQAELSDLETDIAVARGFIADAQAIHRTRVQQFPDSIIAKLLLPRIA
jgi:LemA protein